ncbi:DUF4215 domain-containing protein [Nannocystis sp.]|uniref:DUF4215 domain-containing protein n=1 Tax=Nannocystis sp. TaxID=1962667 RepID=UPI0025D8F43B|nr:DUF4215 domain-containing protein [Nannocystis sp.]MBK7825254.1 DUF4215 domain-containing protein [Nannocystis sp.]
MIRHGLPSLVLAVAACSMPNPLFEVDDSDTGGTIGQASTSVGPASETVTPTSGPDTDSGPTSGPVTTGSGGVCGDGMVDPGETCDDGNQVNYDGCTNVCTLPKCGDGIKQAGEECDDGNTDETDSCRSTCEGPACGDGFKQPGESCDDGVDNGGYDLCKEDCSGTRFCGDQIVDMEETCDDGNDVADDGCDMCVLTSCGDGKVQAGEECDDGNDVDNDACTNKCKMPACGDGVNQPGEECDDGNAISTDACTADCKLAKCGDGFVWEEKEECDDKNLVNEDSCLNNCKVAVCGDTVVWPEKETCDDGNNLPDDGCTSDCVKEVNMAVCGDGKLDIGEECDPMIAPWKDFGNSVCSDCTIKSCFKVHNGPNEEPQFIGNTWLTACTEAPGQIVVAILVDEQKKVVYAAKGNRGMVDWTTDNITIGVAKPGTEFDVKNHKRLVLMTRVIPNDAKKDWLMLTSQVAVQKDPYDCHTAMGDGYGVAIFPEVYQSKFPRMLVMGANGGQTGLPRPIVKFTAASEISYSAGDPMSVCNAGVTGFAGTFYLSVF